MENPAQRIVELVRGTVGTAQSRIQGLEQEALKAVKTVQHRIRATQKDGLEKLDTLVTSWNVKGTLDKLRANDLFTQGVSFTKEVSDRFGLVLTSDFTVLKGQVDALRDEVGTLRTKLSGKGRDSLATLQKQVMDLKAELGRLKGKKLDDTSE